MMTYLVSYRGKSGRQEQLTLEAPSRVAAFSELSKSGISAIRVEEASGKVRLPKPVAEANPPSGGSARPPAIAKGLVAGVVVVVIAMGAFFLLGRKPSAEPPKTGGRLPGQIADAKPTLAATNANQRSAKDIASEFNEQAKEFIKKAVTNEMQWIVPPIDPNDPDNALRTRVCQELGSLLSIEPGEPMPPFPYSFLLEDDMREAKARGEDVGEIDNGNKDFIESLAKFKIVAKETDDNHRLAHKEKLLAAQGELLDAIDEGLSVNDTIRAAYEFRKRAYKMRTELSDFLREIAAKETGMDDFKEQVKMVNSKLKEEGIKTIPIEEILPDYEESEETAEKQHPSEQNPSDLKGKEP